MGLDEALLTIAEKHNLSWTQTFWFNGQSENEPNMCKFVNADTPNGLTLGHPTDGKGPDWLTLWAKYGKGKGKVNSPTYFLH